MLLFIIVSGLVVSANAVVFTDCGSELAATVQKVSVSGCAEDAKECVLKRNTNVTFSIDFTPNKEVTSVETVVNGDVGILPLPFVVPQPDACKDDSESGLNCPLQAGKQANYQTALPIQEYYSSIKVDVKWELKTEDEEEIVCVVIPAEIQ